MVDWWTEEDKVEYERRVQVMVDQANEFEVEGQKVQGKLTCGENIADLGGLRLAYRALRNTPGFDDTKLIGGFTPTQRFYLAWATGWRQNIKKERALQLLTLDPHGPNEMRTNSPLSNIEEFHQAFGVKETDPMHKPKGERVDIWQGNKNKKENRKNDIINNNDYLNKTLEGMEYNLANKVTFFTIKSSI